MGLLKKGDEVRVLIDEYAMGVYRVGGRPILNGSTFPLEGYDGYHYYLRDDSGHNIYFDEDGLELVSEESSESENSDIQVSSSINVTILEDEYTLTKEEARELSEKLIKELS
jgi:hypothetical protein